MHHAHTMHAIRRVGLQLHAKHLYHIQAMGRESKPALFSSQLAIVSWEIKQCKNNILFVIGIGHNSSFAMQGKIYKKRFPHLRTTTNKEQTQHNEIEIRIQPVQACSR